MPSFPASFAVSSTASVLHWAAGSFFPANASSRSFADSFFPQTMERGFSTEAGVVFRYDLLDLSVAFFAPGAVRVVEDNDLFLRLGVADDDRVGKRNRGDVDAVEIHVPQAGEVLHVARPDDLSV